MDFGATLIGACAGGQLCRERPACSRVRPTRRTPAGSYGRSRRLARHSRTARRKRSHDAEQVSERCPVHLRGLRLRTACGGLPDRRAVPPKRGHHRTRRPGVGLRADLDQPGLPQRHAPPDRAARASTGRARGPGVHPAGPPGAGPEDLPAGCEYAAARTPRDLGARFRLAGGDRRCAGDHQRCRRGAWRESGRHGGPDSARGDSLLPGPGRHCVRDGADSRRSHRPERRAQRSLLRGRKAAHGAHEHTAVYGDLGYHALQRGSPCH